MAFLLAMGCSRAAREQRASQDTSPPSSAASTTITTPAAADVAVAPIEGHPPVTTTGVVAKFDPQARALAFQDGRRVMLTTQSQILDSKTRQPIDPGNVKAGDRVLVENALPVAVKTAKTGKRQRMATVASVDEQNQIVRMTDGSSIRVTPSTNMRMGMSGPTIVLADLRPGDEVIIVMMEETPVAASPSTAGSTVSRPSEPSALPNRVVTGAPSDPTDAGELMVFREAQAP